MGIKLVSDTLTLSLDRIQKDLRQLPADAHKFWVNQTPKKTGNARQKTKLQGNMINADYPYAQPLDKGSSRQAPQGMSRPTEKFIKSQLDRKIRK